MMMFLKNPATLLAVFFAVTTTVQADDCNPCLDGKDFNNDPTDLSLQIPNLPEFPTSIRGQSTSCALIAPLVSLGNLIAEDLTCAGLRAWDGFQNRCCVEPSADNDFFGEILEFLIEDVFGEFLDFCFSDRMEVKVQVEGGAGTTTKRMDQLKIGDKVLTTEGGYSKVYSFGHMERNAKTEFLQIHSSTIEAPLEITSNHMLYVSKTAHAPATVVPAGAVQVGDYLRAAATAEPAIVTAIRTVVRQGAYGPLTESGTIVVQGVVASNYVLLPKVFQEHLSFGVQHLMGHVALSPYRLYCSMKAGGCEDETYNETTGYSNAVMILLPALSWAEWMLVNCNMVTLVAAVLGYYVWKKKAASADKSIVIKK